jgi:hypothetical protein
MVNLNSYSCSCKKDHLGGCQPSDKWETVGQCDASMELVRLLIYFIKIIFVRFCTMKMILFEKNAKSRL